MKKVLAVAGTVLLAAVAVACGGTDSATAPAAVAPLATVLEDGKRVIEYAATCEMNYAEQENAEPAIVPERERVIGRGTCNVRPIGASEVVLEGWATYPNGRYLIEGQLHYVFRDGSRLVSNVRIAEGEMGSETVDVPFDFGQHFLKGTGRLAGVFGGQGYGAGRMNEAMHRAIYTANGRILLAVE